MRGPLVLVVTLFAFAVAGCGGGDDAPVDAPPDPPAANWQLLGENRPSSLLAAWANNPDDVWLVGGREGNGGAPTVLHFDGTSWTQLDTGETNVDLWQVFGFSDGTVFFGGSGGAILRYQNGVFERLPTPSLDIVFGLWGSAPDDVWAVGGQFTGNAFVWHYDGTQFEEVPNIPADLVAQGTVWKVTGRAANDVWFSCSRGMVMHWNGSALMPETIGTSAESLFSIGCDDDRCVAAGTNLVNGVLYENDGSGWVSRVPTPDGPVWRGVTPQAPLFVVGMVGAVLRRGENGEWVPEAHELTTRAFHAAWSIDDNNLFVVGGEFDRLPTTNGVVLYRGDRMLPALP